MLGRASLLLREGGTELVLVLCDSLGVGLSDKPW